MKIYDVVWGNMDSVDKDVTKIIKHPAMQRVKNIYISAYGYLFDLKRNATRYEHTVGVYLLLKHFKASKEEQLAGLIHDVSHTAFSHVSTYAFQGKYTGVEFHELEQHNFIEKSGLAKLLNTLGYNAHDLLHSSKFTLLENELPDICADRLDYALRDGLHMQILSRQQVNQVLKSLIIHNGEFVFSDAESAFIYSFDFYILNKMLYGSPAEAHFNNDFARLVKYAIKNKILTEKDWFSNDVAVIKKLKKSTNKQVIKWLGKYNNKMIVYEDLENPQEIFQKKIRIVDPKVLIGKTLKRLSEIDLTYKRIMDDYKRNHGKHEISLVVEYKD